jgi:hypothetical protein
MADASGALPPATSVAAGDGAMKTMAHDSVCMSNAVVFPSEHQAGAPIPAEGRLNRNVAPCVALLDAEISPP